MCSEINNGKEYTNNMFILKLAQVLFLFITIASLPLSSYASEKTWVIVIDAGHGGRDPGALGANSREKDINLAIALKTGYYIQRNLKNVKVLYTRNSDVFPGLKERADLANKNKADLFISIHANWAPTKTIRGAETYIMGISKDEQNLEVAKKENGVILLEDDFSTKYEGFDPESPESSIIFSLMQNVFQDQSADFASKIQDQFRDRAGRIDRGVKQDVFLVLYMTSMPSVLIETGFITNPDEEKYLSSTNGQDYIASAIFRATREYINEMDRKSSIRVSPGSPITNGRDSIPVTADTKTGELTFMVQITTSVDSKELIPVNFKGITDVMEFNTDDRFKYATGKYDSYSEAAEFRKKILSKYPDAFVIAVKDNKILPLQEALNLQQKK
jgi:N-acetylmuramoyl-L-alanine amidase